MNKRLLEAGLLATALGCTSNVAREAVAPSHAESSEEADAQAVESTVKTVNFKVRGFFEEEECAVASDDPILNEKMIDESTIDCEDVSQGRVVLPFRQVYPEVVANRELDLFHPGHAQFFMCEEGSRMVLADKIMGKFGRIQYANWVSACLEDEYSTVDEKRETCVFGTKEVRTKVACDPKSYKRTVTWECR